MASKFSTAAGVDQRTDGQVDGAFDGLSRRADGIAPIDAGRDHRLARAVAAALTSVVEPLEDRRLMAGDAAVVQALPFALDFNAPAGGLADKDGDGTGFTWAMANKTGTEHQPALVDLVGGRLRITTTGTALAGGPWENDNTLVNGLQTGFNASAGSFGITARLIGPLGYLNNASEQGGLLFGPDQDNYVKLVAVAQPNGQFLQFVDEQKPGASFVHGIPSANSYTNVGAFANINTLDLTIAGDAATGQLTAYYRINGGTLQQVSQTLTLSGSQKAKFFSATAKAGLIAMQKNDLAAETLVFESFAINPGTPQVARPSVRADQVTPGPGEVDVQRDSYVSAAVNLPNVGKGVDSATLNKSTVKLYRTGDKAAVAGHASTSGAGDTITFQPDGPLDANTQYTFEVTAGVKDTAGATFVPFTMTFTTGSRITPTDPDLAFEKVALPTATGQLYSSVKIGPDGKLYATTLTGLVQRFTINTDGTLSAPQTITTVQTNNGGNRFITSIAFDPASTAGNLIAYVSHGQYAFEGASDWTGRIARLTGPNLENYTELVTGLPRAIRDHLNNQLNFGPDGGLYWAQGSSSAMGAADGAWGLRNEHLLTAAVLRLDVPKINVRIGSGLGALDARTEGNASGTNYDPWAAGAPLTIYATGVRNAYDLVWTRDGKLYAPTNGSAAGGSAPASPAGSFPRRIDQDTAGPYGGAAVPALNNVPVTASDYLFRVEAGGYYGHPNSTRAEYVLNGGNPSDLVDYAEFTQYPSGTQPDRNYRGAAYDFGKNHSPDGAIEYQGPFLNGKLDGKLLVVRYSGGADVMVLTRDGAGNITNAHAGISGLSGFVNPLDLTQDLNNGNLYVADYGAQAIYLARPVAPGARIGVDKPTLRFSDDYANSNTTPSATQKLRIYNNGTQPLALPGTALTLSNTTNWVIVSKPPLPTTVAPGDYVEVGIAFKATSGNGTGVKTATLTILSNDTTRPSITVNLRGLAAAGIGGMNEPSLQRILDLYEIPVRTGDTNPANTNLLSNAEPLGGDTEEVLAPRLAKAGPGPVTVEPLAVYAGGSPAAKLGYYQAGTGGYRTELVSVGSADAQTVNPTLNGTTSFDPGAAPFGLYAYFPIFDNTAFSEDSLNTKENTASARRKVRFYPLKAADGTVVPNAYVFTTEDFVNDATGGTDSNDFVGIIRNVTIAAAGPEVGLENADGAPFPDRLVFSRVQVQPPDPKTDPVTGATIPVPNNVVHDTAVVRVRNTGSAPLTLGTLAVSSASAWQIVNAPAAGTQIAAGGFLDLTVKFVATTPPPYPGFNTTPDPYGTAAYHAGFYNGTLTIGTDDADEPTTTVKLAGWFQTESEKNQEPSLPVMVNNLFGYKTRVLNPGQSMFVDAGRGNSVLGEEVVSRYWVRADASAPVKVQQLAAYHSQGNTATVRWAPYANTGSLQTVFVHDGTGGQSVLPYLSGSTTTLAGGKFSPYTAANNPLAAFAFKIDTEWSDDALNKPVATNPNDTGHHVRFWPARDQDGALIPNTWLMGMDYLGINYDYQDNLYVVTNMRPMPPATPAALTAVGQPNGIALDWDDVTAAPLLSGYNVYRSAASGGPWAKLTDAPVAASQYVDATAPAGTTFYYRVTAADNWQGESAASTVASAVRSVDNQPPAAPAGLVATGVGTGIQLAWAANNDVDLAGYRVFRSDATGGTYSPLNGGALVNVTSFLDATAQAGTTWFYKVAAVDFSGNESALSDPATATAGDHTAPAAPTAPAAASTDAGIRVAWTGVADADLAGYRVYRSATVDGAFALASGASLVAAVAWTDAAAAVGETWYYKVAAVDASGNESPWSAVASATRTASALPTVRINAGGPAYTDSLGNAWQADQYFTGGTAAVSSHDVAGTADDPLYLDRRWGAFTYAIPVPNGAYTLSLHFSDPLYTTAGKRAFSVKVEGATVLSNFDLAANGGGKTKLVRSFDVTVADGVLNLQTIKILDNPIISGIELVPQGGPAGNGPAPEAVAAATALNGVRVTWSAAAGSTPAGYNLYRSASADGTYVKVNGAALTGTAYTDTAAPAGQPAYYKVTAITSGVESARSAAASATAPLAGGGTGLVGRYYAGTNFNTLKLTRTDSTVNFDWASGSPNPAVPSDNFSVRWSGKLLAPVTGDYTFTARVGDSVRLLVDGQTVVDRWSPMGTQEYVSTTVTLQAGQQYAVRLDYGDVAGAASAKLYWQLPGMDKVIVPRQYLYTA